MLGNYPPHPRELLIAFLRSEVRQCRNLRPEATSPANRLAPY